jgi:NADP-dependent 3-hydroxy acid dehydrogenase YdfG
MNIKDSVILITGASSGIGEAAAKLLAKKGARVALAARSKDKLEALSKELPGSFVVPVDMTSEGSIKNMIAETLRHYGRIDVLVNNAGKGSAWLPIEQIDIKEWKELMDLNVYGPVIAMKACIPIMREQGAGAIINIGSGSIHIKKGGASIYPGSKVLLNHISHTARLEVAADNISVSIIHPYITKTNFFNSIANADKAPVSSRTDFMSVADSPDEVALEIANAIEIGIEEIDMSSAKMNR